MSPQHLITAQFRASLTPATAVYFTCHSLGFLECSFGCTLSVRSRHGFFDSVTYLTWCPEEGDHGPSARKLWVRHLLIMLPLQASQLGVRAFTFQLDLRWGSSCFPHGEDVEMASARSQLRRKKLISACARFWLSCDVDGCHLVDLLEKPTVRGQYRWKKRMEMDGGELPIKPRRSVQDQQHRKRCLGKVRWCV